MTLLDDDQRVAAIIKDLEQRIADLEETSRSSTTPNPLLSEYDRVTVGDRVVSVSSEPIGAFEWNDDPTTPASGNGWDRGAWEA